MYARYCIPQKRLRGSRWSHMTSTANHTTQGRLFNKENRFVLADCMGNQCQTLR